MNYSNLQKSTVYPKGFILNTLQWPWGTEEITVIPDSAYGGTKDNKNYTTLRVGLNTHGEYVGSAEDASYLWTKYGIRPEHRTPDSKVTSIGKGRDNRWYGWSHRAIYGFQIGDTVKPESCGYSPSNLEEMYLQEYKHCGDNTSIKITLSEDNKTFHISKKYATNTNRVVHNTYVVAVGKGCWTATTEQEAKEMAKDFAESVSSSVTTRRFKPTMLSSNSSRLEMDIDWESMSSSSKTSIDAAIKLLTAIVMSYEFDFSKEIEDKIVQWETDSKSFFRRFKIPYKDIRVAVQGIQASKDPDDHPVMDAAIRQLLTNVGTASRLFKADLNFTKLQLTMLNDLRLYKLKGSTAAEKRITQNISSYHDNDLNSLFVVEVDDMSTEQNKLSALVKKHTGKPGTSLPVDILKKWQTIAKEKGVKLKDHVLYLKLTGDLRKTAKSYLLNLVRNSGTKLMSVADVIDQAHRDGVYINLPKGFVGKIDDSGKFYTVAGLQLRTAPAGDVKMNPAYRPKEDNAYVCEFLPLGGQDYSRAYTIAYTMKAKQKNFNLVADIVPKLKALSRKWIVDLNDAPKTSKSVLAATVEYMYETGARVGGMQAESKGERTFGTTQLQVKHIIHLDDMRVHIRYHGKSKGLQNNIIKFNTPRLKKLGKALNLLVKGKAKTDYIFAFNGVPFSSPQIKRYMTSIGFPAAWSAKKLRTAKGTLMFSDAIAKAPFKKGGDWTEREVHQWVEARALDVGAQLGHSSGDKVTPNTAIQNYIDPSIADTFYKKLGIRPSAKFQKAIDSFQ